MAKRKHTGPDPADYPLLVRPLSDDDGGGYLATVPDLPWVMGDGESPEEAVRDVRKAMAAVFAVMRAEGETIPLPSPIDDRYSGKWVQRVPKSLHRALAERARIEGVSLNTLVTTILSGGIAKKDRAA
jgi:antitoxin HicB